MMPAPYNISQAVPLRESQYCQSRCDCIADANDRKLFGKVAMAE